MPSNNESVQTISRLAGADFSGSNPGQYRFGKINSDGEVVLAGNGERAFCVIHGKAIEGEAIACAIGGRVRVVFGATVAAGAVVQSDANGACITQASTGIVCGTALEGGAAGEVGSIVFDPQGAP